MPTHQQILTGALCALTIVAGACKEEEGPNTLFDEKGTWALSKYDLGEGITNIDLPERIDQFLLNFDQDNGIVSAAACVDSMGRTDITESLCDTDTFACRCFNYTYNESLMVWTEFQPTGNPAPPVPDEDSGAVKPGDPFSINLDTYPESSGTYRFSGLPFGLFSSDGTSSKYVFQVRGDTKFTPTGCLEICGASTGEPPAAM
jgi:hypothetical protein